MYFRRSILPKPEPGVTASAARRGESDVADEEGGGSIRLVLSKPASFAIVRHYPHICTHLFPLAIRRNRPNFGVDMAANSPLPGPYSARLQRGAPGHLDKRSTLGRYAAALELKLVRHVTGQPNAALDDVPITTQLLIARVVRTTMQLDALDEKLSSGNWTDHDCRTHGGLINRQRLLLRELGMSPAPRPQPTLAEHIARRVAERARA